jgi:hypothetical protein
MNKILFGCVLALTVSISAFAVNWSAGGGNTYVNGAQNNTFTLGVNLYVNNNASTADAWLFSSGMNDNLTNVQASFVNAFSTTVSNSSSIYMLGSDSLVNSSVTGGFLGKVNTIQTSNEAWILGNSNQINYSPWTNSIVGTGSITATSNNTHAIGASHRISGATRGVTIGNGDKLTNTTNAFNIGFANEVTGGTDTGVLGSSNIMQGSTGAFVMGRSNQVTNAGGGNVVMGDTNVINSTVTGGARHCYLMGAFLNVNPTVDFSCLTVLGVLNKEIPLAGTSATDDGVLLIVGNGNGGTNVRSNALVMQKSGRTVITNRNYVTPTAGQPRPVQPETLVVQGAVTVEGDMTLNKRQGDIWMGGFGRTEDQGPTN